MITAGFPQQVHLAHRPWNLLGSRDSSVWERGPVGTALRKTESREHVSATHLLLLLCGLSFPRARDPQSCAWLQFSKAAVQADRHCWPDMARLPHARATAPSQCPISQPDPAPNQPELHLNVCHAPHATHPLGTHTWPFLESSHMSRILVSKLWWLCCC